MELDRHEGYSFDWMTWVDVQHSAVESALAHSQYNKNISISMRVNYIPHS